MVASSFILFDVRVPRNSYAFMFVFCRVSLHNFCVRLSLLFVIRSSFLLIGVRTCATADVVHNVCVRDNRFVYTYLWGGKLFSVCRTIWLRSHFFLFLLAGNIDNVFCWLVVCGDGTHNMYSVSHPFPVSHRQKIENTFKRWWLNVSTRSGQNIGDWTVIGVSIVLNPLQASILVVVFPSGRFDCKVECLGQWLRVLSFETEIMSVLEISLDLFINIRSVCSSVD